MAKIKIEKYTIECKNENWLSNPGLVIYVEKDYDVSMNENIMMHLETLEDQAYALGCKFVFLPMFLSSCEDELIKYMTGRYIDSYDLLFKHRQIGTVLDADLVDQLQGPSLLFSGLNDDQQLEVYRLSPVTRQYRYGKKVKADHTELDEDGLKAIFDDYASVHQLFTINAQIEHDHDILFRMDAAECMECSREIQSLLKPTVTDDDASKTSEITSPFGDITLSEEEKMVRNKAQELIEKLLDEGLSQEAIWAFFAPEQKLSTIKITESFRIILPEYDNMEIPLPAIQKAVYFLFLKHPEGIYFKDMYDYREELLCIYRKLAQRGTTEKLAATIDDLVNPLSNSMNEKCSRIKNMFNYYLTENLAKHYYISGDKGERKMIEIDANNIIWEKEI